jgi:RNA recognition motif-containing protein
MTVVHVRNLSTRTDENKLRDNLEKYGKIEKIDIIRERATG